MVVVLAAALDLVVTAKMEHPAEALYMAVLVAAVAGIKLPARRIAAALGVLLGLRLLILECGTVAFLAAAVLLVAPVDLVVLVQTKSGSLLLELAVVAEVLVLLALAVVVPMAATDAVAAVAEPELLAALAVAAVRAMSAL
tara:strand:- start:1020 stop:1442 length:423 start_codon:yes stop_codon:yes gene_type:complete